MVWALNLTLKDLVRLMIFKPVFFEPSDRRQVFEKSVLGVRHCTIKINFGVVMRVLSLVLSSEPERGLPRYVINVT